MKLACLVFPGIPAMSGLSGTLRALGAIASATAFIATAHAAEPIRIGVAVGLSGANSVVDPYLSTYGFADFWLR
jgi:hypothetical protein